MFTRHYFPERILHGLHHFVWTYILPPFQLVIIIKRNDYKTQYRGLARSKYHETPTGIFLAGRCVTLACSSNLSAQTPSAGYTEVTAIRVTLATVTLILANFLLSILFSVI